MRFISKYAFYTIAFQTEFIQYLQDGQGRTVSNTLQPMLDCKFSPALSLNPWELKAAEGFRFRGTLVEADEMTPVTPVHNVSVFDTENFAQQNNLDVETRERLEKFLIDRPEHGIDYMVVYEPKLMAPWPAYDEIRGGGAKTTAEKVVEQVVALGFANDAETLETVIAYERQNLARPEVIEALEPYLIVPEEKVEELVKA